MYTARGTLHFEARVVYAVEFSWTRNASDDSMAQGKKVVSIPTTLELIEAIKVPKVSTVFDRIEKGIFLFAGVVVVLLLAAAGLESSDLLAEVHAKFVTVVLSLVLASSLIFWAASQLVEMGLALRKGFRPAAMKMDEAIEREKKLVLKLSECDEAKLRERGKHLELKVKSLTKRAGLVTALTAIGVVTVNLYDAGEKANIWSGLEIIKLYVYAGSIGLLIGSVVVATFASQLEQIDTFLAVSFGLCRRTTTLPHIDFS